MNELILEYLNFVKIYDKSASIQKKALFCNHELLIVVQNNTITVTFDNEVIASRTIDDVTDEFCAETIYKVYQLAGNGNE